MGRSTDTKHYPVRTIRLPVEQIVRILDEMDGATVNVPSTRRDSRYRYRLDEIVVLMQQPGHSAPMAFIVPTRNISARGLAFLHGGYVHPGTVVVVQLVTTRGAPQNVVGVVRRCRYMQSNVHEVAIQFKNPVDPAVFCRDAVRLRVLLAEDDAALTRLARMHLSRLNCEVENATDGHKALELASQYCFDLILLDMDLPVCDGYTAARELRKRGFTGMIIAGTGSDAQEDRKRALEAGCDRHLVRPFSFEALAESIGSLQSNPLFSSFHDDPAMADLVVEFVSGLMGKIRALEEAQVAQDTKALRSLASDLKVEGRAFGFAAITAQAARVEDFIRKNEARETTALQVRALIRLCAQARPAPKAQSGVVASALDASTREAEIKNSTAADQAG